VSINCHCKAKNAKRKLFKDLLYEYLTLHSQEFTIWTISARTQDKATAESNMIAILTIHLHLPGCASLKEKRGYIKPLIARLQREFNLSVAEMDLQDQWQQAVIGCVMIGNQRAYLDSSLQAVRHWVDAHWTDGDVVEQRVEFII
jgi:uncharacterized protein YlxP (DUF503 family)